MKEAFLRAPSWWPVLGTVNPELKPGVSLKRDFTPGSPAADLCGYEAFFLNLSSVKLSEWLYQSLDQSQTLSLRFSSPTRMVLVVNRSWNPVFKDANTKCTEWDRAPEIWNEKEISPEISQLWRTGILTLIIQHKSLPCLWASLLNNRSLEWGYISAFERENNLMWLRVFRFWDTMVQHFLKVIAILLCNEFLNSSKNKKCKNTNWMGKR